MTKYIFVTGGVVSGLGKGITAASLGRLLKQRGIKVAAQKLDPYMNVDPGTMSPFQHGEVFVTEDGAETDLDLGHYERFIDENLSRHSNLTAGRVYWNVLNRERSGDYEGKTVQVIPHITDEIMSFIYAGAKSSDADVLITEIGGTVGDIESQSFLEAIRRVSLEQGRENCLFIHVTLIPYLKASGEHKSKPTQHSVKELRMVGLSPDIIVVRAEEPVGDDIKEKISSFCNVKPDCVIENLTLSCLYEAPIMFQKSGLDEVVCRELKLPSAAGDLSRWQMMIDKMKVKEECVTIAVVGKYVKLHDAYLSVVESLHHGGGTLGVQVDIRWIDSEQLTKSNIQERMEGVQGMIVPGGFGERGIEGMIAACTYARENQLPYLGICLGMQIGVIEFARNVCGLSDANSGEFAPNSPHKVIDLMEGQKGQENSGGTMRLGAYPCVIKEGTLLHEIYDEANISERHRHRYEFNNDYREILCEKGLVIGGTSPDNQLVEAIENPAHPSFVGVQFHPEFKSRPDRPHPLFTELIHKSRMTQK